MYFFITRRPKALLGGLESFLSVFEDEKSFMLGLYTCS